MLIIAWIAGVARLYKPYPVIARVLARSNLQESSLLNFTPSKTIPGDCFVGARTPPRKDWPLYQAPPPDGFGEALKQKIPLCQWQHTHWFAGNMYTIHFYFVVLGVHIYLRRGIVMYQIFFRNVSAVFYRQQHLL